MQATIQAVIIDDFHPVLRDILQSAGCAVEYLPSISAHEVISVVSECNVLIVRTKCRISREIIDAAPRLLIIARGGAGMDNIDEAYAVSKGIVCLNAPEGNRDAVGEHAVGLMLALAGNIVKGHNEISRKIWNREGNRGFELGGKTIGIIGYGNTGSAVASRLASFGCRVIAYDKYKSAYGDEFAEECSLNDIYSDADVVSVHVPLTPETHHMISKSFISNMKKPFMLLNLSRGQIADTKAVTEGLETGRISHFGADVLENEKIESYTAEDMTILDTLCNMPNVVLTPHVAGWSTESYQRISEVLGKKIIRQIDELKKKEDRY